MVPGSTFISKCVLLLVSGGGHCRSLCGRMDKRRWGNVEDSEEHYRGEKMRGDTRGEMRKDKDIKSRREYMRYE